MLPTDIVNLILSFHWNPVYQAAHGLHYRHRADDWSIAIRPTITPRVCSFRGHYGLYEEMKKVVERWKKHGTTPPYLTIHLKVQFEIRNQIWRWFSDRWSLFTTQTERGTEIWRCASGRKRLQCPRWYS